MKRPYLRLTADLPLNITLKRKAKRLSSLDDLDLTEEQIDEIINAFRKMASDIREIIPFYINRNKRNELYYSANGTFVEFSTRCYD